MFLLVPRLLAGITLVVWLIVLHKIATAIGDGVSVANTSREQAFDPRPKWALVPEFFVPGIRNTFSPGWCLQPGLKVPAPTATAPDRGGRDL